MLRTVGRSLTRVATRTTVRASVARAMSSAAAPAVAGGQELERLTSNLPHLDVVRYEHKNRVWSMNHVQYYSEALAIGLLENGLQKGDKVLSWLPDHFSEQVSLSDTHGIYLHMDSID